MRKITPEDLFGFQLVGHVTVHPSQYQIVYQQQQANRSENRTDSWLMMVEPGHAPRRFTAGPSDSHPRFAPDGLHLAFLSERSGSKQIWLMPTHGGEARQITHVQGGVEEFQWAPDATTLVYIAMIGPNGLESEERVADEDPAARYTRDVKVITEVMHKMDGVGFYTDRRPHLVVQDIAPGSHPRQVTAGPMRHESLAVSPDGRYALTASRYGEDYDRAGTHPLLYLIDLTGQEPPRALNDDPLTVSSGVFASDGRTIYFQGANHEDLGYDNVGLYRTTIGGDPVTRIAPDWDRPFSDLSISDMPAPGSNPLLLDADGQHLFVLTSCNGTTQLARAGLEDNHVTLLTTADQVFYSYDLSHDRRYAALCTTTPLNPGQVMWLNLETGEMESLANPNQELLEELMLSEPRRFTAQAADGPPVEAWVMEPVGLKPGEKAPLALEIHGGPMMMYAQAFFFEFQWLAANGYGVVYSNPRGSQGYGRSFCIAIKDEWGHLDYQDVMAALDGAVARESWVDTARLGVLGGSYGGYMTNWIVSHTDRFKAAITMRSVVDWKTMLGTGDIGFHWINRAQGAWPWSGDDAWYRQQSPITYVENITTPLLIEHQEGDLRCPINQGDMLFTAMKYFNKAPVKYIRYPEEFHGMSRNGKPWHRVFRLRTLTDWFDQYLKEA